ncbi:Ig-like domain-containing protein [Enterobacter ludwigii]
MAGVWGSAQQNGAGDALRGVANSEVNAALTQEVEAWLNHTGGKARVTADVGIGGSDSRDFGLDYLWPVKIWQHDILFTQMSAHRWNDRDILNVGLGWRHTFNPHLMAGGNLFFDQDVTRHHNRMGIGGELWSDSIRTSANYYLPLSGWRHSDDSMFNDDPDRYELYERAARGWDLNLETALSQHVALKMGWFQWYGDKVDVNGSRSEASHNPHGLNLGLKWQPVPLVGVSAEQSMISGQRDNFSVGLNFHWEFGRKLSEMLASENAVALPSLMQSRTEFVTRNNNIVLAYKQEEKDRRLYFSPTEKITQAGVPLLHAVKGGQGGIIRYSSSSTTIATVEPGSGLVNPTHRGDVTITATETSPVDPEHVLSSASYHLTVTPGDFAPSVEGVAIQGDMSPGQTLTGSYLYKSNEGEDEDLKQTRLRWYDADSGEVLKEGHAAEKDSAEYEVKTRDMARSVAFEVTPFNKKGTEGKSGSAKVNGSAKLGTLHVGLMAPGEVRPDGSVKFYVQSNGALQLLTEVKNDKEEALEGLIVYWASQNALGHLSQRVTQTDSKGQTSVNLEEILSSGQDQITASLSPLVAGYSGNAAEDDGRHSHMKLNVNFAKASSLTFIQPPEHVLVGAVQPFTVKVTDQDGEDFKTSVDIVWQSNGQPIDQPTHTNNQGEASISLTAPTLVGTDWEVTASVEGGNPVTAKIPLVADVATAKVSALEVVDNSAVADGTDTTSVRVTVKDAHENPVAGQVVNFRAGAGIVIPATATTEQDGTVTVTQTSLKAGEFRVDAVTGNDWTQAKYGLVNFDPDNSTAKVSTLEVVDNSAVADGTDTTSVRVTVKDAHENPVAGQVVNFRAGAGIVIPATATTEQDGTVTVTQTSLKAGEFRVDAVTGNDWTQAKYGLVNFDPDNSTAKVSTLEVVDNSAVADGTDTTSVRVTVKDAHENPVAGQVVNFRAGAGIVIPATATTEQDGTVTVTQTSLKAGEFRVDAVTGNDWTQAKYGLVNFDPDNSTAKVSTLEVVDNSAVADGTDTTSVRVTVKDAHENPVAGQVVNFRAGAGIVVPATATTEQDGTVTVTQTSQKAGEFRVDAVTGDNWTHAKSVLVNFVPGKVNRVTFIDVPESVQADGVTHATWQIAMFDSFNNPVPNTAVNWSFSELLATKIDSQSDTMTNDTGVAKLTLQMGTLKAENLVVTAKSENNIENSSSIALSPVAGSVELSMASTARVDEPVTLTVTAKDKGGILMPGAVVAFSSNHPDWMVITPESATTGSNGVATAVATIRPEKGFGAMGGYTLTAKVSESVKDSKTLQLSVGQIDHAQSSLTPVSDTIVVGNQLSMLIAMKDKFGNPITGLTGRIGAVLADSQGRNNGGLIHTNSGGIAETEKGNYPFNVKGTRADIYSVTPIVDRVELSALKATVKVMAQKPWIVGTPQIGYTLTIGKGSGFSTATVNWKVNGSIYRSSTNIAVDNASLELTDITLVNQKVSVEIIDSQNSSLRLESDSVTIRGTPSVSNVKIKGDSVYGNQISVDYDYHANGGGDESGTQYQWYWSQNIYDKSPTPIPGATGRTLKTDRGQYGLYLYVSVTPGGSAGGSGVKVFNDGYFRVTDAGTPSVSQLHIKNEARVGNTIEASYIFNANGSGEDNSLYQWASWDEFSGRYRDLDGENGKTLYIKEAYGFLKNIRVSVTPRGTLGSQRKGDTAYSDPVNIVK